METLAANNSKGFFASMTDYKLIAEMVKPWLLKQFKQSFGLNYFKAPYYKLMLIHDDCLNLLPTLQANSFDSLVTDPPAGISFMGKKWDSNKGGRNQWVDWMTTVMQHCFRVLKPGSHGLVWALPRTSHWTATALENAGFEIRDIVNHLFGSGFPKSMDVSKAIDKHLGAEREVIGKDDFFLKRNPISNHKKDFGGFNDGINAAAITAPATNEATKWNGWGTALKPACEHWILIRKPLEEKTVAANVIKWGTGAINIDATRIDTRDQPQFRPASPSGIGHGKNCYGTRNGKAQCYTEGRFPANLICSDPELLQEQAKYFYCPKASRKERNAGCEELDPKKREGWVTFEHRPKVKAWGNHHPTVKPLALMQYLCKLVTPPNGIILDPFAGSGTTGIAAMQEGFQFYGIEKEQEYFDIAKERLNHHDK